MRIDILITVSGFLGLLITILSLFFDVKPAKRNISKRDMGFIILWLALTILGIVNLYYIRSGNNINDSQQSNDTQNANIPETSISTEEGGSEPESSTDNAETNLSEDELLIKQNFDLIQQLKAEYTDKDAQVIENDSVEFSFYEIAGYMYQDLLKSGKANILAGKTVSPDRVIIFDYSNDDIIYSYSPENNNIIHYPDSQKKFYCVVFHDDYDVYVSPPIQTIGGESYNDISVYLDKKDSEYTSLFQTRLYMRSSNSDESYSIVSDNYIVQYSCRDLYSDNGSTTYQIRMSNSGIISSGRFSYFSLNTNYVMNVFLCNIDDESRLAQKTVDSSTANSNLVEVYFEIDNKENNTH